MSLTAARSRLEYLPLEAKQAILSSLTDIAALQATALTCSSLYHAFKNAEQIIVGEVFLNQVDIDVLPEALIAHASKSSTQAGGFAAENLRTRLLITNKRWKISEVLPLSNFSRYVNYFAVDFARKALASSPRETASGPSREELNRIKRAFYRFEIYRNMVSTLEPSSRRFLIAHRAPSLIFMESFSPWENEQLACVHDYLYSILAPVFNEIVEHDVAWGEYCVKLADDLDSEYVQALMYLGLEKVYNIAMADSYEKRYKLIYEKHPRTKRFLYEGLQHATPSNIPRFTGQPLHYFKYMLKPFYEDQNPGPADAWILAHEGEGQFILQNLVNTRAHRYARRWGYVMWDWRRLDDLDMIWKEVGMRQQPMKHKNESGRTGNLEATWERRQLIYMAGGRGWWSESDESRVKWPNGRSPWDGVEKRWKCPYCIGEVKCAPHRLILSVGEQEADKKDVGRSNMGICLADQHYMPLLHSPPSARQAKPEPASAIMPTQLQYGIDYSITMNLARLARIS